MKNTVKTLGLVALSTFSLAVAQQNNGGGGQGGFNNAQRQQFMRNRAETFELLRLMRQLDQLEKDPKTAISKTQAKTLIPIVKTLQTANTFSNNDAKKYLAQIQDKVLTDAQLTFLDDLYLKQQKERQAQIASGQRPSIPGLGMVNGQNNQNRQNGQNNQNGQRGNFDPNGNPFKTPRATADLKALLTVLQKK